MAVSTLNVSAECEGTKATVKSGSFIWTIDEPSAFGGNGSGPSPVEVLMGAIAGCVAAAGNIAAKDMGITVRKLNVRIQGDIDSSRFFGLPSENRSGFLDLRVLIDAEADWTDALRRKWLEEVRSRCPVIDNIAFPTPIMIKYSELNDNE